MMAKYAFKRTPRISKLSKCDFRLCSSNSAAEIFNDPVQLVFQTKLREYKQRSKNGEMVEPTPEMVNEFKSELERINRQFGGDGKTDLTKFPEFKLPLVELDPILSDTPPKEEN